MGAPVVMMRGVRRFMGVRMKFVIARLLLLAAATAFACDDGNDAMSADEYFAELDQVFAEADAQGQGITDPFASNQDATLDERKAAASQAFDRLDDLAGDVIDGLRSLDPPTEVERLHGLLIDSAIGYRTAIGTYTARIERADTNDAFDAAAENSGAFEDAIVALEDICIDLQDAATEHEIQIDLKCGE